MDKLFDKIRGIPAKTRGSYVDGSQGWDKMGTIIIGMMGKI